MIRWLAALWLLALSAPVHADEMRPVAIQFEQVGEGEWRLGWRQPIASAADDRMAMPQIPANCRIEGEVERQMAPLAAYGAADVTCTGEVAGQTIGWPAFPGHGEAILRVSPLGRALQVHRLTPETPFATIAERPSAAQVWRSYFVIGVEHILAGWDHLLFVIALVILVARPWPVVKAATAFTIAHSITLAAVTLGFSGIRQDVVEALIALSIVFLAVEIARGRRDTLTRRLPWLVAFAFGLLHGFGFAGALREIGLPEGEVPAALVSFNLGVEAGQLLVIAAVLALLRLVDRLRPRARPRLVRLSAYGVGIMGSYWLIDRLFG
ncbi:HupE/UreJ family protein [Erythrobacter sp.]|uniref:HupE/UreJ family protein n=1 Tax=Erythrobacter sp. TaxID=1042 RepID=UPI001B0B82A2|nr:HupE/UreJ family protein [Erythrobacter sp.]MBO6527762.1 HupE/UreJ family protein [Erythrobacter sp.]MBO6529977.1 HupE/UreJ family protein [Erythrobacter sp.]